MIVDLFSSVYVWTAIAVGITIHFLLFPRLRQSPIPVVNKFKNDFLRRRAYTEYSSNAKELLARGLRKHRGPIGILVPGGTKIVLPASFSDWVKSSKDLDHQQLVRDEYFASYPGFEAQYVAHHPDRMLIDIVRSKLAQNESTLLVIAQHLSRALSDHWGESDIWHKIDWHQDTTALVSRAAASVFIGPEKAEDPEWQRLIQSYVGEFFSAVGELHGWPSWLRPIAHWFLPHCCALRAMVPQARSVLRDVVRNRMEEAESARAAGQEPPAHNDAVAWTMAASTGANLEHGDVQLALGMVALFTTSEALRQVLIDIARDSNLAEALREEIHSRFTENGFKLSTLFKLELMDSVLKESQRCAAPLVGLERLVVRDTVLPNGVRLPRGSHIMVDSSDMWNPAVYENPESFDGYRYLNLRHKGEPNSLFVQSSQQHNSFGGGRHHCPGRFFANNELKLCLAYILSRYDIRLADGYISEPLRFGIYVVVDPNVQLEVRRHSRGLPIFSQ